MKKGKKAVDAKSVIFKRLYGVKPAAFEKMLSILQDAYDALHEKGGKPPKLTVKDKLCVTLKYLRKYRTMDSIAAEYGVCKARSACLSNGWKTTWLKTVHSSCPEKRRLRENQPQFDTWR
ncbi:MAG: transposase family protein [Treponema sp.]|jgi:hypothetical protein|nr:transposase family protein [Treponema sp.]